MLAQERWGNGPIARTIVPPDGVPQGMRLMIYCIIVLALVYASGCATANRELFPGRVPGKTVYVIHRDLHTALVVRQEEIPAGSWPSHPDASRGEFIEIGWGDNKGYRFPWTSRIVVRALFWPTPSVLFVRS